MVVVRTRLEADEEASAQRISAQLPSIADKINQKSSIKVGVSLDERTTARMQGEITRQLSNIHVEPVSIGVKVTGDAKKMLREAMSGTGIEASSELMKSMTQNLTGMDVQVGKIHAQWVKVGREKERLLQLDISGRDALGKEISLVQQYAQDGRKVSETVKDVTLNIEKLNAASEAAAKKEQAASDKRAASLTKLEAELENVRAKYEGLTRANGVVGSDHLAELNKRYGEISASIERMRSESGALSASQRSDIDAQINALERLATEYSKAEHVATELRTKTVWQVNADYASELDAYEKKLKSSGLLTSDFEKRVAALRVELAGAFDSKSLTSFADQFDRLKGDVVSFKAGQDLEATIATINREMAVMPSQIEAATARFNGLIQPSETLKANMEQLRRLSAAVNSEQDANRKIEAYNRLRQTLALVNTEMASLTRTQNTGLRDEKLFPNIEKAKADLLTVGRTWSALKTDKGLNAQFEQLLVNLDRVNNASDLSKWRAEFNKFKSDVKAAGKNVQSLGDTLQNNLGKVLQWVSATTLLFRAFRYLKQGIQTVVDLDTAMIDLRKVTKATSEEYRSFYESANETAKRLNVTTEAVISQTAEWARLGFALQDAAKLAENSAIFAAVSPGMEQQMATDGLVSIIKAYGVDVNDTLDGIISKINEVGKQDCPAA